MYISGSLTSRYLSKLRKRIGTTDDVTEKCVTIDHEAHTKIGKGGNPVNSYMVNGIKTNPPIRISAIAK